MTRSRTTSAALLIAAALTVGACNFAPTSPQDSASFHVTIENTGTTPFSFTNFPDPLSVTGVPVTIPPGDNRSPSQAYTGKLGDRINFDFFDQPSGERHTVTCTLSNPSVQLLFTRVVQYDASSHAYHCVHWGD